MRALTKTGIRMLSAKYRSILIKCAIINASVFIGAFGTGSAMAVVPSAYTLTDVGEAGNWNYYDIVDGVKTYYRITPLSTNTNHYTIAPEGTTDFTIRSNTGTDSYHVTVPGTASSESRGDLSGNVGSGTAQLLYFDQNNTDASIFDAGAITNLNDANNYDIYADFVSNHTATYGGAIRNGGDNSTTAKIHIINGDFVINQSGYNNSMGNGGPGGAIVNGVNSSNATIDIIKGNFIGNQAHKDSGGAIMNQHLIGTITGDFLANSANSSFGGVISNIGDDSVIDSINGNFVSNLVTTVDSNWPGVGGAIYNSGTINNINGDFILNMADKNAGAIKNARTINNINGDFILNSAMGDGGAIYNEGTISNIEGDFILNTATATSGKGGAIYNSGTIGNIADGTGGIVGNFIENSATTNGGAILNENGIITSITGNFESNSATTNGGAIHNSGTIGNIADGTGGITGNFNDNTTKSGSAIYNTTGTITNIKGNFTSNASTNGYGAIYNQGGIIGNADGTGGIVGDFNENTGTNGSAIANAGTITNIKGNFTNNSATNWGGAIVNVNTINKVTGDFTNNFAKIGGAVYNARTINFVAENDKNITFSGNYVTDESGNGGAIYNGNGGTVGLYADEGHSITFVGGDDDTVNNKYDIDGIYNQSTLNINGDGTITPYTGTVNLYNVTDAATAKGTTNIYGGTVNVKNDAVFNQSTLNNQGIFNFNGTTGQVTNLADAETAKGTTNIKAGSFTVNGATTQKAITVTSGAELTTKDNVTTTNGIANAGTLNLLGGMPPFKGPLPIRAVINSTVSGDGTTNFGTADSKAYIQTTTDKAIAQTINLVNADVLANSALGASGKGFDISEASTLTIAANNIKDNVANAGTLNLCAGILEQAITGTGTTVIDGIVTSSDTIAQDALTINGDMTLTASADNLSISNSFTNNGTLVTYGNLNNLSKLSNTTNTGTVQIATGKELNVTGDKNLGGTLDLNGQTLNMQEQGETTPVVYSTLTVNTLKGTGNLLIDANVNETNTNADKIAYTNADSAVINLTNINVREGFTTHTTDAKDNYLTVLNGSGATFKVGGDTGKTSTQFGDYLYTFEKGTTDGTLKVTEEFNGTVSLADYITGTEKGRIIDTYSFANNETLSEAITTGSVSAEKNPYTIGMNGKNLTGSETNNGITISTGKTLTIDGNGGTISEFNTALINEGTLNLENVVFSGNTTDVSNAGTLNLTGENTFGSKITGETGTVTNSGTLNIAATNLDVALTNNNILNLGEGILGKVVTGTGTITTKGDVSSNASYLGNAVTNTDNTLTLTEGTLAQAITGGNVTIDGDVNSDASIASAIAINATKSLSIDADNVDGAVTNAGTLNLGTGTLAQVISGEGTIATTGNVASNASNLGNVVTNTGHTLTLTLTGGALNKTVTGGNVTIDGDVTSNASIASAIGIDSGKSLTIDADKVGGVVANSGTLNLGTGTLEQNVNGEGTININGDVVVATNKDILNTVKIAENSSLELNADLIDATKANITENLGTAIMNGGTLSSDVAGAYETKVGGDAVTTTTAYLNDNFTNKGTLNLTSDIDKDIKGNGTTVLSKEGTYVSVIGNRKIDGVLNSKGKTIDMQSPSSSVSYNTLSVGTLNLGQDISLMLDSNIVTQEIDKISADAVIGDGKINMLLDIPNRIDTVLTNPNITLNPIDAEAGEARTNLAKALRYDGHSITSPIFEYTTNYDENTGLVHIAKKTGTDGFNKYLYNPSVAAHTTAAMTTQIATLAMDKMDDVVHAQGRSGGDTTKSSNAWIKVMGLNDNVEFKNFNTVDSKAITVAGGFNTDKIVLDNNVSAAFGAYAGYIGGKQHYTDNDIDQNGGYVGLSSVFTSGNAFLTATVNGGLLNNKADNMYGNDKFRTLWLGTGLKTGYNYAITDSVVLQPNVYGGYTLVNTEDYTSASGVKIATHNLNFFEIDPGLKLSAAIADGWTGSVQGKYAIVMDNGDDITANDIALQNISTKNYFEYGIGVDKSLTDAVYLGAKINRHDGGRTGWNGSIEFRYKF